VGLAFIGASRLIKGWPSSADDGYAIQPPPSTPSVWPVMKRASSLARNTSE
jgi:hypothetical protein